MLGEVNNFLNQVSSIKSEINRIKNMPSRLGNKFSSQVNDSIPDFSSLLGRKKAQSGDEIGQAIEHASRQEGIDEELIYSVIEAESGFDPGAVSHKGARGLMQLMPGTADKLGVDPDDPVQNVQGGTKYLGEMIDRYGDLEKALAAYNAGPRAVDEHGGIPPFSETQNYVKQVLQNYRQLKQSGD